jgi:repressor LexA
MIDRHPLTDTQTRVLAAVRKICGDPKRKPPTLREIGTMARISNVSTVTWAVARLEALGYVTREPNKHRSIRLI